MTMQQNGDLSIYRQIWREQDIYGGLPASPRIRTWGGPRSQPLQLGKGRKKAGFPPSMVDPSKVYFFNEKLMASQLTVKFLQGRIFEVACTHPFEKSTAVSCSL